MPLLRSWEWWKGSCLMWHEAFLFLFTEVLSRIPQSKVRKIAHSADYFAECQSETSVRFPWHRIKEVDDSCNFKSAILSEFLVGDDTMNCWTRGFVCFWFVLRAGIPELLTRAFFWDLALGHLNVLHLKEASFNLLGLQASKHFPIERWQWICFLNYLCRRQKTMGYKFQNHWHECVFPAVSLLAYLYLSVICPSHLTCTPYFPFLSGMYTQICVSGLFLSFEILVAVAQLIWNQHLGKYCVFVQGRVDSWSLCVDQVFGSCRVGCVYGASVLRRNFLSWLR